MKLLSTYQCYAREERRASKRWYLTFCPQKCQNPFPGACIDDQFVSNSPFLVHSPLSGADKRNQIPRPRTCLKRQNSLPRARQSCQPLSRSLPPPTVITLIGALTPSVYTNCFRLVVMFAFFFFFFLIFFLI